MKATQYGFSRILRRLLRFPPLVHTTNSGDGSVDLPKRSVYVMWHSWLQDKGRLPDCSWTNHEKPSNREPSCLRNAESWPLNQIVLWILAWRNFFLEHLELMVEDMEAVWWWGGMEHLDLRSEGAVWWWGGTGHTPNWATKETILISRSSPENLLHRPHTQDSLTPDFCLVIRKPYLLCQTSEPEPAGGMLRATESVVM